jgi:hypothetical protein
MLRPCEIRNGNICGRTRQFTPWLLLSFERLLEKSYSSIAAFGISTLTDEKQSPFLNCRANIAAVTSDVAQKDSLQKQCQRFRARSDWQSVS